jgi:LysM repeat protein
MKKALFLLAFVFIQLSMAAQSLPLEVQLDVRDQPYLNHAVGGKENFYSIGRIYNISPRVFAPYNGLELTSGLSIGQVLRIPLNETNFWQSGTRKENEVVIPVYYTVKQGEGMAAVARLFKTDEASLRSWNNGAAGKKLIIGFLKVDKSLSPLAAQGVPVRSEPEIKKQEPVVVKKEEPKKEPTPVVKEETKKEQPKTEVKKEEPKKEEPRKEPSTVVSYSGSGFFKDEFNRQTNNGRYTTGSEMNGATFKSTSGWSDGKYYVLIDGVEKGAIVLIKNPANGKAVYAKVLAGVQETKPGTEFRFLLSNAAAAQLGISAESFSAELVWPR